MDVNDTERKLHDAVKTRNEIAFDAAIAACHDFKQIFKFTHQCATATFAQKISVREKITLENMMECGLKRMHALDSEDWLLALGDDANKAVDCLHIIEHYADP